VRGTPLAVLAMAKALGELGHDVDLLAFPQGADVELPRLRLLRSLPLPVGRVRPGPSLAKLLLDLPFALEAALRLCLGRYDAVHAVEEAAHLIAPLARLLRVPLVMDVDSQIPDQLRYSGFATRGPLLRLAERLERYALLRAAAVITVCRSLSDGVARVAPRERVFQIEDPPLLERPPDPAEVARLRASLGLGDGPLVLYAGSFEPYQGVELLVDAAQHVSGARFVFVGGEPAQIDALRARAGGAARVSFAGKRDPAELPAFLALADVVVSPRIHGTNTPFKVYSYLASGKPLVATRLLTHTQLLDDSLAILVEPTPQALADGIRQALADPAEAARRAERGRALIEREYSRARFAEKVRAAYAGVAAAQR
jgi:glycosyltransferase involved in cell wall biosynthesis